MDGTQRIVQKKQARMQYGKEELTHDEVRNHLKPPKQDSATRHERVEQQYWAEEEIGRRRSPRIQKLKGFTGGYANAVENLSRTWYNFHEWINQEYKIYTNSVINEETGKKME